MQHGATALIIWFMGGLLATQTVTAAPLAAVRPLQEEAAEVEQEAESVQDDSPSELPANPATRTLPTSVEPGATEDALGLTPRVHRLIQRGLAASSFDPVARDGVFGARTRDAIRAWQTNRGEEPTDYLDRQAADDLEQDGRQQHEIEETQEQLRGTQEARSAAELRAAAAAEQAAAQRQAAAAQQQAGADRAQYVRWIAVAAAAVALVLWLVSHRSVTRAARERATAEGAVQAAQSDLAQREERDRLAGEVPAVFRDDVDEDGRSVALRVLGRNIAAEGGVVAGRNPYDSTAVIDHPAVSRRHFRLFNQGTTCNLSRVPAG